MRGLLVGITGLLGAAAFWRRRQKQKATEALPAYTGEDPAGELRAKLAESRATENADTDEPLPVMEAETSPLDPQSRRKSVHDRARASIDDLK